MLAFFRRIRKTLFESGQTRKYALYAIGEIALVVIGILIALQINNWNEWRKDRVKEKESLLQLFEALDLEMADLKWNINSITGSIKSIDIIQHHLNQGLSYIDSLDFHFGNSSKYVGYVVKPAVYENLKFAGLNLITNDSLRNQIVTHYDYVSTYLTEIEKSMVIPHYNQNVLPLMMNKFDFQWVLKPATPSNYDELRNDGEYQNVLKTTKEILNFQSRRTKEVLDSALNLRLRIEDILEKL